MISSEKIKVSLVEDDADFQLILSESLRADQELELSGVYSSAEAFMKDYENNPSQVVVMDIHLPALSGIDCVRRMKQKYPLLQFTMCTVFEDNEQLFESLKAGAVGYLLKHKAAASIADSVKELARGGSPISTSIARKLVESFQRINEPNPVWETLTGREKEILQYLSKGYRYKEIAGKLFISDETVRTHVRNLYEKLQVQSRTEAINKVFGKPEGL